MLMDVNEDEVLVAHRMGVKDQKNPKPRLIVVRCAQKLIDRVFQYTSNLKGKKNGWDEFFYVKKQLPEPLSTEKKEREEIMKTKKSNAEIPWWNQGEKS